MSHLISTIAFTEPEHGPNMDLLGTSPKASLGQYTSWQEWHVLGAGGPWGFFSDLLLPMWTEVPGDRILVSLEWGLRLKLWLQR